MRILIAADTRRGTLMASYADALRGLQHEVCAISVADAATRSLSPWLRLQRLPVVGRVGLEQLRLEGNRVLTAEAIAFKPDLMLTTGFDVLAGTIATIRAMTACKVAMVYPDTLVNLSTETIQSLPLYDLVAYACGRFALPVFEELGARQTTFLPFAWDPELHPRPPMDQFGGEPFDVVFVGEWRPDRELWLETLTGVKVGVWGSRAWQRHARATSVARQGWQGSIAWGAQYAEVSRSGKITLNLVDVTNGPGLNMRAFEAAGVGCFVLSTRTDALEETFTEDVHIAFFSDAAELHDKVHFYLRHPQERERIARNAAALADTQTYQQRAQECLAMVGLAPIGVARS